MTNSEDKIKNLEEQNLVREAKWELERSNTIQSIKAVQQISEQTCSDKHIPINASLGHAAGVQSTRGNAAEIKEPKKWFFHGEPIKNESRGHTFAADSEPVIRLGMPDKEIKRRTGFPTESVLLLYIFVVCNGDVEIISKRQSSLTWYEEWFLHFEYKWGKSLTRLEDVHKTFGPNVHVIESIISAKYIIEYSALNSWPTYALYAEDVELRERKPKWKVKWKNSRPVCWDMTNIVAYEFTDSNLQKITYSPYYGQNCFKGGVFTQFCGWQGTADLWTGGVSDTDYNKRAGYLQRQQEIQSKDVIQHQMQNGMTTMKIIPFLNIYDKGYRAKMAALKHGKQQVLQPDWADSDRRFKTDETIHSTSIASDRGGNERSVNVSKRAGYIQRGFRPKMCPIRFNIAWRSWGFQTNFMFQPHL